MLRKITLEDGHEVSEGWRGQWDGFDLVRLCERPDANDFFGGPRLKENATAAEVADYISEARGGSEAVPERWGCDWRELEARAAAGTARAGA